MVFSLRKAGKRFGSFEALRDISLQVREGEQIALVGPSGAGKSTLLSLLNGAAFPTSGEVRVLGHDLGRLSTGSRRTLQRQVGTIYQQFYLTGSLRVVHNVNAGHLGRWSLARALFSLVRPLDLPTALQALRQVGIPDKLYERTDNLSGGEQQRVALARVLVQDPRVILADEPIASLDPARSIEIMDLLRDLSRTKGKTLIASVHAFHFAQSHFDRIVGLRAGQLLFDMPARDVTPEMATLLYRIDPERQAVGVASVIGAGETEGQTFSA